MTNDEWKAVQRALQKAGLYKLTIDGIPGQGTRKAVSDFQRSRGYPQVWEPDRRTLKALGIATPEPAATGAALVVPAWGAILNAKMGLHEVRDKALLETFLRSDGSTLGDPSVFPWCGDLAETVTLNADFGPVPSNPYLARNWATFGRPAQLGYFTYAVYSRPGPKGSEGHVGFTVGISADKTRHRVRGGNEQNQIGDVWIAADRLIACRLPTSYKGPISALPVLDAKGQPLSTNEA